jgi:hypothetical protein
MARNEQSVNSPILTRLSCIIGLQTGEPRGGMSAQKPVVPTSRVFRKVPVRAPSRKNVRVGERVVRAVIERSALDIAEIGRREEPIATI